MKAGNFVLEILVFGFDEFMTILSHSVAFRQKDTLRRFTFVVLGIKHGMIQFALPIIRNALTLRL